MRARLIVAAVASAWLRRKICHVCDGGRGGAKLGAAADPDRCLDCNFRAGRDDGSDPKAAAALYEKLITEDKVDAVIGPYGSAMTDAAAASDQR